MCFDRHNRGMTPVPVVFTIPGDTPETLHQMYLGHEHILPTWLVGATTGWWIPSPVYLTKG